MTDIERLGMDMILTGNAYIDTETGRRVPPEGVIVMKAEAEPAPPTLTQDQLLTALDELLDSALHDDHCYTNPDDTHCACVVGRVRAVLPPCGAMRDKGNGVLWACLRNAHPSTPGLHYFG